MFTAYQAHPQNRIPAAELFTIVNSLPDYIERTYQALLVRQGLTAFSDHKVPAETPEAIRQKVRDIEAESKIQGRAALMQAVISQHGAFSQGIVSEILAITESVADSSQIMVYSEGTRKECTIYHQTIAFSADITSEEKARSKEESDRRFATDVSTKFGLDFDQVLAWQQDPDAPNLIVAEEKITRWIGTLIQKSPEDQALDYTSAYERITAIVRKHYPQEHDVALSGFAAWKKTLEKLIADLAAKERRMQELLTQTAIGSDCDKFFKITVFCSNPATYTMPAEMRKELIATMVTKGKEQIRVEVTETPQARANLGSTPKLW